jgi:hypothetical protein
VITCRDAAARTGDEAQMLAKEGVNLNSEKNE